MSDYEPQDPKDIGIMLALFVAVCLAFMGMLQLCAAQPMDLPVIPPGVRLTPFGSPPLAPDPPIPLRPLPLPPAGPTPTPVGPPVPPPAAPEPDPEPVDIDEAEPVVLFGEEFPSGGRLSFLLDCSGSMGSRTQTYWGGEGTAVPMTRLDVAKRELGRSIAQLDPDDEFNAWEYRGHGGSNMELRRCFPRPRPANGANKAAAIAWMVRIQAAGGTPTGPAVATVVRADKPRVLVLLTDGAANGFGMSSSQHLDLAAEACQKKRTQAIVFGIEAYPYLAFLLQGLASATAGAYFQVDM